MKNVLKAVTSLFFVFCLIVGFSVPTTHASSDNTKIPDAFNAELEKQKLNELQAKFSLNSTEGRKEGRIYVYPDKPLVLTFDDGSTITYTSKVETAAGNRGWSMEKSYSYMFGYAKIEGRVEHTTVVMQALM
ncbi:hypothetical protein [Paenibacillus brasilensis]|uniref:hypothetical protein n=1 Tax=Paenibacillus brasilensis TaxID=128574 RepID=UPI001266C0DC|nr:hypothetical protein [Paenibacillus brasilensis]